MYIYIVNENTLNLFYISTDYFGLTDISTDLLQIF